jgi:hypothetical protein
MPFLRSLASEWRSVASHSFRLSTTLVSQNDPLPPQATNIATSALVIARMLISMTPNTACTRQPI